MFVSCKVKSKCLPPEVILKEYLSEIRTELLQNIFPTMINCFNFLVFVAHCTIYSLNLFDLLKCLRKLLLP